MNKLLGIGLAAAFSLTGLSAIAQTGQPSSAPEPVPSSAPDPGPSGAPDPGPSSPPEVVQPPSPEVAPVPSNPGVEAPRPLDDLSQPDPTEIVPTIPSSGGERLGTPQTPVFSEDPAQIIEQAETYQSLSYANYLGFNIYGDLTDAERISQTLEKLARKTGTNPALMYVLETRKGLELVLVLPSGTVDKKTSSLPHQIQGILASPFSLIASLFPYLSSLKLAQQNPAPTAQPTLIHRLVSGASSAEVKRVVKRFRKEVSDPNKVETDSYKPFAKTIYDWIITPLKPVLAERKIDTLVFSLDKGLRSMPIAALNDGQQFLVEQYNLALIPSFSLTDTRYQGLQGTKMLGMGITQSTGGQSPLPSVAVEVPTLTSKIWQGTGYLDQQSTIEQFKTLTQQERFSIIHLATHASFNPGRVNQSYIQFWNERLTLPQLRSISLNQKWTAAPNVEMLVLSACQSALGNNEAELGFTGLAVQSGVKTAVGSLWSVSDEGSLGLMSEFYRSLRTAPIRAAALREAQLGLLKGQVKAVDGQLQLRDGTKVALPDGTAQQKNQSFAHPYYWSAFTMVGNWN
jgi:CHAT domain-containing protein